MAIVGRQIERVDQQRIDDQRRYALITLRRQCDKGVSGISAYRVSQKGATARPHTTYMDQIYDIIKKGDTNLDQKNRGP